MGNNYGSILGENLDNKFGDQAQELMEKINHKILDQIINQDIKDIPSSLL